jgi:hypothetical protein
MKKILTNEVLKLQAELEANGGLVPDSWKHWIDMIKAFLKIAELFCPSNIDVIIEEIIAAINVFEGTTK